MGVRILLIEDEPEIADFVARGLREEGFTVERAADGEEGWHRLTSQTWDVVLLDWWLPGLDGFSGFFVSGCKSFWSTCNRFTLNTRGTSRG